MAGGRKRFEDAYDIEGPDEARCLYAAWAPDYDHEMVEDHGYTGPVAAASAFAQTVPDRNASILDAGCGTGLVGQALKSHGFSRIDGLDLVQEMLDQAALKGVYQRLVRGDLLKGVRLNPNRYDAAISVGTFTHAHVGPDGLDEVFRLVKPGGLAMIMVNAEAYVGEGYPSKLDDLSNKGIIKVRHYDEQVIVRTGGVRGRLLTIDLV